MQNLNRKTYIAFQIYKCIYMYIYIYIYMYIYIYIYKYIYIYIYKYMYVYKYIYKSSVYNVQIVFCQCISCCQYKNFTNECDVF